MANPDPSPGTRFGTPGGPDPSEAGKKGGAVGGYSILAQMHKLMDEETSKAIAQAHVRTLKTGEDIALFKEFTSRQDGLMTQKLDQRVTSDRTVVVDEGDGTTVVPPGGGE